MKKTREEKSAFSIGQTTSQPKSSTAGASTLTTPGSVPFIGPPQPETGSSTLQTPRQFDPPLDPTSTASGSGIALLRYLSPPSTGWQAIQHYPSANIAKILSPLLEPDSLAYLIAALHHGISVSATHDDEKGEAARERVKDVMWGMKSMPRWKVNAAMLSRSEREMGRSTWEKCGGEGEWP